jgi:hypothetical protein
VIPVEEIFRHVAQGVAAGISTIITDHIWSSPIELRQKDSSALLGIKHKRAFLDIWNLDHHSSSSTISLQPTGPMSDPLTRISPFNEKECHDRSISIIFANMKRCELEGGRQSYLWFYERQRRTTGSKCGRILMQYKRTACASPDGWVHDSWYDSIGIIEFECRYTTWRG